MNVIKIDNLNDIIETHPQFKKKSLAYDAVSAALDCTLTKARELVATHCNMLSLYACIRADEKYHGTYHQFFKLSYLNGFCNHKGYIGKNASKDKPELLEFFSIKSSLTKYEDFEDIINPFRLNPDKFYQIKMKADTQGFHYISGYIQDDKFYCSCTSYRGTGWKAEKYLNENNFVWAKEI